jgi:hypothetical protein
MFKKRKTKTANYRNQTPPDQYISKLNYENLVKTMELRETREKSIHFRKNLLEKQKTNNYTSELDRRRGDLSQTVLNGKTRAHLENRKAELKHLSANAGL